MDDASSDRVNRAPRVRVCGTVSADTAHKSGSPPFRLYITINNLEVYPITLSRGQRSVIWLPQALTSPAVMFHEQETGDDVQCIRFEPCHLLSATREAASNDKNLAWIPEEQDLVTIPPSSSHTFEYQMNQTEGGFLTTSFMKCFTVNNHYKVQLTQPSVLRYWKRVRISDVLAEAADGVFQWPELDIILEVESAEKGSFTVVD